MSDNRINYILFDISGILHKTIGDSFARVHDEKFDTRILKKDRGHLHRDGMSGVEMIIVIHAYDDAPNA